MTRYHWPLLVLVVLLPVQLRAQDDQVRDAAIRLFLDCQAGCDFDFMRQEIGFVSYVRDRADAQVHLLITAQGTGSGGRRYALNFIGRENFEGVSDTLIYTAAERDTPELRRRGLARVVKMGLMRFVAATPQADGIDISYEAPAEKASADAGAASDPWNFWVFRFNGGGNLGGEQTRSNYSMNGQLRASRTTDNWKFSIQVNGRYSQSRYTLSDSSEFVNDSRNYNGNSLLVKSLGNHFSAGLEASASSSIFANEEISVRLAPALELSYYPYTESTRRRLSLLYTVGVRRIDYHEITIYDKRVQTLTNERITLSYDVQQPWGEAGVAITGSHYFHDLSFNRLQFESGVELRLFRGLSLNVGGEYSRIRDQLSLPKEDASDEEVLVQRRQLATGYEYGAHIGLSYSFGSIFNNVVNPRLSLGN